MQTLKYRLIWALFALMTLAGCDSLKGVGRGLDGLFRNMPTFR
jgi:predicted small secreted protein